MNPIDNLTRRLTGDDPEEAIPDALILLLRNQQEMMKWLERIDEDLGQIT